MVEICYEASDYPRLNETITMLSKRRAQVKEAVGAMVRKGAEYVEGVLGPGDMLFIPKSVWHYVRSLTTSVSVNFWF